MQVWNFECNWCENVQKTLQVRQVTCFKGQKPLLTAYQRQLVNLQGEIWFPGSFPVPPTPGGGFYPLVVTQWSLTVWQCQHLHFKQLIFIDFPKIRYLLWPKQNIGMITNQNWIGPKQNIKMISNQNWISIAYHTSYQVYQDIYLSVFWFEID